MQSFVLNPSEPADQPYLRQMFRQRKAVFADELKWVTCTGEEERDEFDTMDARYIVNVVNDEVMTSVRLLPTNRPHLMTKAFSHLCTNGVPQSPWIYEASRLCVNPAVPRGPRRSRQIFHMFVAMMETALAMRLTGVTCVQGMVMAPYMQEIDWDVRPLGLPQNDGNGDLICAWHVSISEQALEALRAFTRVRTPMVQTKLKEIA